MSNKLDEIRKEIDIIDDQISELFEKRMEFVSETAKYKRENNIPVLNTAREREIIARVTENKDDEMASYTKILFSTVFDLSRSYQNKNLTLNSKTADAIKDALENMPKIFPQSAVVACQGVEGAYSQLACEKLFSRPNIMYFNSFDGVFNAVEKGLCKKGILPIENSLHGSVTEVYDLMKKYNFYIARSIKMKINHALLAKEDTNLLQIKEIYSHEQALAQCSEFIKNLKNVKIITCENTAVASQIVADSDRTDIAAISTPNCAELYGLTVISQSIQNNDNNYTRFICISKELEIYPGANKISLMFTLPHKPGSLYSIISKFSSLGLNLTKLESRPIPEKDFEFTFYIDLDAPAYSEEVLSLISQLENMPEVFVFLGSYSEI